METAAASSAATVKVADVFMRLPRTFVEEKSAPPPEPRCGWFHRANEYQRVMGPVGLNPLSPPPLPPTVEVSATEFCCTALGPVFWVAWRIPWPPIEVVMVTLPLALAAAAFCAVRLPVRLAVLNDDPAPPEAVVVAVVVLVLVVVCDRVPPPTTESFRAASIL